MFSYLQKTLFGADEELIETSGPSVAKTTVEEQPAAAILLSVPETEESLVSTLDEKLINSFDSTDDLIRTMAEQDKQLQQPDNAHFVVGEDTEDGDDFVQEPPQSNGKTASYIMALGEKRKRLRYVLRITLLDNFPLTKS